MKTEEFKFEPILYLEQSFSESAHSLQMHLKIWIWQYWFTIFVTLTHTWKILHDAGQGGKGGTLLASKPSGGKVVYWLLCKMKICKRKKAIWGGGSQEPVLLLGKGIPDSLRRWTLHSWQAPSAAPGRNSLELSQPPGYLATTGSFESGGSRQAYEVGDCLDILTFGILWYLGYCDIWRQLGPLKQEETGK